MTTLEGFTTILCGACGCTFAVRDHHHATLSREGTTFYCPNGHPRAYPKNDPKQERIDSLERQLKSMAESSARWASTYQCPCAGCDYGSQQKATLRKHLAKEHRFTEREIKKLTAEAGDNAKNTDVS